MDLDVADMPEMNASLFAKVADDRRNIVVRVGAERATAERQTMARTVGQRQDAFQIFAGSGDAGQAEHRPGRIVRMNRHLDPAFLRCGNDRPQKVAEVGEQNFLVDVPVLPE